MKALFENFKRFLNEGAKTVEDILQQNMSLVVEETPDDREVKFYLETMRGQIVGAIEIEYLPVADTNKYVTKTDDYGHCYGGYQVTWSEAEKGYGPLMYDIAMEHATQIGNGLTCDRAVVSTDAYKVWQYYLKNRSDIKKLQLDDPENTLTPTKRDNCVQISAKTAATRRNAPPFPYSPLSKLYRKENTKILDTLKRMGKISTQYAYDALDHADYGDSL